MTVCPGLPQRRRRRWCDEARVLCHWWVKVYRVHGIWREGKRRLTVLPKTLGLEYMYSRRVFMSLVDA